MKREGAEEEGGRGKRFIFNTRLLKTGNYYIHLARNITIPLLDTPF
jgi:hypothetical protein